MCFGLPYALRAPTVRASYSRHHASAHLIPLLHHHPPATVSTANPSDVRPRWWSQDAAIRDPQCTMHAGMRILNMKRTPPACPAAAAAVYHPLCIAGRLCECRQYRSPLPRIQCHLVCPTARSAALFPSRTPPPLSFTTSAFLSHRRFRLCPPHPVPPVFLPQYNHRSKRALG
ncbi:hypothetical protein B0H13DRAFT_2322112 [Mycena leptocephala]|nr:hypothetical protein B0H13DRAFT_2322112 [Mycena leptocephala]